MFETSDTLAVIREVREQVTATVGLQTLVSLVLALRGAVTDKLPADTERVLAFEAQLSVL